MFLSVKELELRKVTFEESFQPGRIDFTDENLVQSTPLTVVGTAEMLEDSDGEIRIQGRYQVEMGSECDRCLGRARFPLEASFDLLYRPIATIARSEEVEIDDGEAEIGFYEDGGIELEDVIREQIMLSLPMQRVCSDTCQGICPICGKNRNEEACQCKVVSANNRWGALRELK